MSSVVDHTEANPQKTQRLIGLGYLFMVSVPKSGISGICLGHGDWRGQGGQGRGVCNSCTDCFRRI